MRFSSHLIVAGVVALTGGMAAPACAATGTTPSWALQSLRNPGGRYSTVLTGVSCPAVKTCFAVGAKGGKGGQTLPVAERWNGRTWAVQALPHVKNGFLIGVWCSSARACTAVGDLPGQGLAMRWNGRKWVIQRLPAAPGADVELDAVSCWSPRACTAVGSEGSNTLAEHWNGSKWTIQPTRNPPTGGIDGNELVGVSCSSATSCTAVGDSNITNSKSDTLVEHWNGRRWTIQPTPKRPDGDESQLTGVSCRSARACIAIGASGDVNQEVTLAERWNGRTWAVQPSPDPAGGTLSVLTGLSCSSATACIAVGNYSSESGNEVILAERWNGRTWAIQSTPKPAGAKASALIGVSCSSATACTSVGVFANKSAAQQSFGERYSSGS